MIDLYEILIVRVKLKFYGIEFEINRLRKYIDSKVFMCRRNFFIVIL